MFVVPLPPFREQLLRCLSLTGEMFATIVEGTQYERDAHLRWRGREAADAARGAFGTSLYQLELITRSLVDGNLEQAQECLLPLFVNPLDLSLPAPVEMMPAACGDMDRMD